MTVGSTMVRALGIGLALTFALPSAAAPRICRDLEAKLAQSAGGGRATVLARSYDRAILQQQQQLSRANRLAMRLGCGTFDEDEGCGELDDTIGRMEDNLDGLIQTRRRMSNNGALDSRLRQRLLSQFEAYGCGDQAPDDQRPADRGVRHAPPQVAPRADDSASFPPKPDARPRPQPAPAQPAPPAQPEQSAQPTPPAQTFRTLCVRTCDGYFFPMSHAASESDFGRDQTACEAACPGTEVQLYTYRTAGQNPDSMVAAVGGKPYSALPTAFRFRDSGAAKPAGCTCGVRPKNFSIIAGEGKTQPAPSSSAPTPTARPAAQPAPAAAHPTTTEPKPPAAPAPAAAEGGDRKVRAVGPAFLPDPKAATNPQAPGHN